MATDVVFQRVAWETRQYEDCISRSQSLNCSPLPIVNSSTESARYSRRRLSYTAELRNIWTVFVVFFHTTILNKDEAMPGSGFTLLNCRIIWPVKGNSLEGFFFFFCLKTPTLSFVYFSFQV